MEFLSVGNSFLSILLQLIIYFPAGFLVLEKRIRSVPFLVKLPIFISFGLVITTIAVSVIGLVYIGNGVLVVFAICLYVLLFFKLRRSKLHRPTITRLFGATPGIVALIAFTFVTIHFCLVMSYLEWPPGVDAINHGLLTSILVHNHRLQTTLTPIAPSQPWFEPFGFHVMAAQLTFLLGVFPGESILIFATTIIISILLLIYSLVYFLTGSTAFSVTALLSGFYIYPVITDARFLEKWLIGYFYNTPYSNLFGYMCLFEFIACAFVIFDQNDRRIEFKLIVLVCLVGIAISYPTFLVLPIIYIFLVYLLRLRPVRNKIYDQSDKSLSQNHFQNLQGYKTRTFHHISNVASYVKARPIIIGICLALLGIVFLVHFEDKLPTNIYSLIQRVQTNSYYYSGVVLTWDYLYNFTGFWTLSAVALAIVSLIRRNRINLSIFFLLLSTIILMSTILGKLINDYIWFMFPGRLFAFLLIVDWIMLLTYANDFLTMFVSARFRERIMIKSLGGVSTVQISRLLISLLVISVFFVPSVMSNVNFGQAKKFGWLVANDNFRNDYALLSWISSNVNKSDLIMTDYTYTSRSIQSFSLENITSVPIPNSQSEIERAKDNTIAWDRPSLLRSFVDRYGVKYVLLDSELGHRIPPELGGNDQYAPRLFTPNQYLIIFGHMPFLKIVKQIGSSALYKVLN